jgi:predicted TPR repeat methyltransferase
MPSFETHLTEALDYDPNRYIGLLRRVVGADRRFAHAIDLGCGTGLAAPLLRPFVDRLSGVDLSAEMIARARSKGLYDELAVAGLEPYLGQGGPSFDLFLATDVFVYVGALEGVFEMAARRAAPGAWFAYSAERHDGEGFMLRPTGRFAHSLAYLAETMSRTGWQLRAEETVTARTENGVPILSHAIAAQRI